MPRIHLSISENLFTKIEREAVGKSTTVNLLIIDFLENLYGNDTFNYSEALKELIDEAEDYATNHQKNDIFTLVMLPSFADICVARAGKSKIQPSIIRARLGKLFNHKVRSGNVAGVSRANDKNGKLKFIGNSAVFIVN